MTEINQKEYLKKYLGIGRAPGEKKKKKKRDKTGPKRVKIIDDDADANIEAIPDEDPLNEDAPQIVAIIDERPPSLRVDEKTNSHLWTPIGSAPSSSTTEQSTQKLLSKSFKIGGKPDDDANKSSKDNERNVERDISPPGKRKYDDHSPLCRRGDNGDISPPRKHKQDVDNSPPRNQSNRERNLERDISPPRKRKYDDRNVSAPCRRSDNGDISPPRKRRQDVDNSPPRKRSDSSVKPNNDDDLSPSRRRKRGADRSPPRRQKIDNSPLRNRSSPPRPRRRKDKTPPRIIKTEKDSDDGGTIQTTLDGRKAGLQDARQLVDENRKFRERENELFQTISTEQTGVNAAPVVRDRKTGKIRNIEEEQEHQRRKQEEEEKRKEKYSRWGRGLKQVENYEEKLQNDLHEMSKPLARYADDEDLERYLKEQEREGDPMLAYIRKKKRKEAQDKGVEIKPKFEGEFMPNRYGIRPGHRWDGVDRSNGYEKRWFEIQNAKRVQIEDSYKWSTEDM